MGLEMSCLHKMPRIIGFSTFSPPTNNPICLNELVAQNNICLGFSIRSTRRWLYAVQASPPPPTRRLSSGKIWHFGWRAWNKNLICCRLNDNPSDIMYAKGRRRPRPFIVVHSVAISIECLFVGCTVNRILKESLAPPSLPSTPLLWIWLQYQCASLPEGGLYTFFNVHYKVHFYMRYGWIWGSNSKLKMHVLLLRWTDISVTPNPPIIWRLHGRNL